MCAERKSLMSKVDSADKKLGKMSPGDENFQQQTAILMSFREQIRSLDTRILEGRISLREWKRIKGREWMRVLFGGLLECSTKGSVVATFALAIIGCVPTEETHPGRFLSRCSDRSQVERLAAEAERELHRVSFVNQTGDRDPQPPNGLSTSDVPGPPHPALTRPRPTQPGFTRDLPGPLSSSSSSPVQPTPTHQLVRKVAAIEKKAELAAELAKHLQAAYDAGKIYADTPEMRNVNRCVAEHPPLPCRDLDRGSSGCSAQRSSGVCWSVAVVVATANWI